VYLLGKTGRGYWTCFYSILSNSAPESKPGGCYTNNLLNSNWFFLNPKMSRPRSKSEQIDTQAKKEKNHMNSHCLSVELNAELLGGGGCCSLAAKWIQMNDVEERGQRVTSCSTSRRCLGQTLSKLAHRVKPLRVVHNVIHSNSHSFRNHPQNYWLSFSFTNSSIDEIRQITATKDNQHPNVWERNR
jgi:hypothetical protein